MNLANRAGVSVVVATLLGFLLWPRECVRTAVGSLNDGESNAQTCTSVIGLPTHWLFAVIIAIAAGVVLFRKLKRSHRY